MTAGANLILAVASAITGAALVVALVKKNRSETLSLFLFLSIVVPTVLTTFYLAGATIVENQSSATRGPVHWHADYEIYVCGKSAKTTRLPQTLIPAAQAHAGEADEGLDLVDPKGISNRVGTSDFHEHGDKRIHVEGVVKNLHDISLGKFFEAIGGQLTPTLMRLPTNHGDVTVQNGTPCADGQPGAWQVFVYQTRDKVVTQVRLENFVNYVISPYSTIPPGDCIIFEFSSEPKNQTNKICPFYEIAIEKGELKRGN